MDEVPMITSIDIKMKDNVVLANLLEHSVFQDLLYDRNAPNINGINFTPEQYHEYLS